MRVRRSLVGVEVQPKAGYNFLLLILSGATAFSGLSGIVFYIDIMWALERE